MDDIKLSVVRRTEFGKGAARRIRRDDKIPAVIYGHGTEPIHLVLNGHETMMALKNPNALLTLENPDTKGRELAIAKDVQRDPVRREILHVDLIIVKRGEKIEVEIPIVVEGDAAPGTLVSVDNQTLTVLADATALPSNFTVDIEGREVGEHLYAADVKLPKNVELVADPELLIVNVSAELSEEELEAELESDAVPDEPEAVEGGEESEESESEDSEGDEESAEN